jgi:hypothetical protein
VCGGGGGGGGVGLLLMKLGVKKTRIPPSFING